MNYKEFVNLFEAKKYDKLQFDKINIQKLFVLYFLNKENITDFNIINNKFVNITNKNLNLTKSQITKLKHNTHSEYIGLDLLQLLDKIKLNLPDLFIEIYDINYDIKERNKVSTKSNRLIFFGLKKI